MMENCPNWRLVLFVFYLAEFCPPSGQSETQRVQRIVGESYTFPVPVMKTGSLSYGKATIAMVVKASGDTALLNRFKGRLQWDSQTGLFTITDLTTDDEGEYRVQNNDGKISTFQLTVYKHVSKPTLMHTQNCSVLCSVENGREVTLSWYRGDERLNQTSSPDLNTSLSLPLVLEESNSTYSCEVRNPVSSQHHQLEITDYCSKNSDEPEGNRRYVFTAVMLCCVAVVCVAGVTVCVQRRKKLTEEPILSLRLPNDVDYAEVIHNNQTQSQPQGLSELASGTSAVRLTTVYDEIKPNRR